MNKSLCISFRFIQPFPLFHGRAGAEEPEWPPSPLRVFQAIVNSASLRARGQSLSSELRQAFQRIEVLCPVIVAPRATLSTVGHRAYVPLNQTDLVTSAWHRGEDDASIASHRMEKDIRPHLIETFGDELPAVHYVYSLDSTNADPAELLKIIRPAVRAVYSLGWGIDQVVADASQIDSNFDFLYGERWSPNPGGGTSLRVHRNGSLNALDLRHASFLNRLVNGNWTPVPPLGAIDQVRYKRDTDPISRPHAIFKLLDANDDTYSYPQFKLKHIAGMVRHLALDRMEKFPPTDLRDYSGEDWLCSYVRGLQSPEDKLAIKPHAQLSFVPLPSIGHQHADPSIRRVMIIAPLGDDAWLEYLSQHLNGEVLEPLPDTAIPPDIRLDRVSLGTKDGVRDKYVHASNCWASFTPVILPGYDDHKPEKTRKLIERALQQSGVEQACEFEWSPFSFFPKALSAHKYDRQGQPTGYYRPKHLLNQTAVHLRIQFNNGLKVPGPLLIGSGRHIGFGLMAGTDT